MQQILEKFEILSSDMVESIERSSDQLSPSDIYLMPLYVVCYILCGDIKLESLMLHIHSLCLDTFSVGSSYAP